jgi:hypothetical protein
MYFWEMVMAPFKDAMSRLSHVTAQHGEFQCSSWLCLFKSLFNQDMSPVRDGFLEFALSSGALSFTSSTSVPPSSSVSSFNPGFGI